MKSHLLTLDRAVAKSDLHEAIIWPMITDIDDNQRLQEAIQELLPFLSDADLNIRGQAISSHLIVCTFHASLIEFRSSSNAFELINSQHNVCSICHSNLDTRTTPKAVHRAIRECLVLAKDRCHSRSRTPLALGSARAIEYHEAIDHLKK
jgi:hypothetical protein